MPVCPITKRCMPAIKTSPSRQSNNIVCGSFRLERYIIQKCMSSSSLNPCVCEFIVSNSSGVTSYKYFKRTEFTGPKFLSYCIMEILNLHEILRAGLRYKFSQRLLLGQKYQADVHLLTALPHHEKEN